MENGCNPNSILANASMFDLNISLHMLKIIIGYMGNEILCAGSESIYVSSGKIAGLRAQYFAFETKHGFVQLNAYVWKFGN